MKAIKLLDLKNASPDSRLCKTVTVPVLWSGHDSLSPGCYSAVAFTSVCRVAELHSCNNSGYHILWLSGCCWWHGLPHVMRCSWSREKQISIPRLSIYPNCMIGGRHCNLCYLDMVAGGSQCSDYYPGGSLLPDSDNDGLWMSTQLVTVVTMTNLHCSRYMILCQTLGYKYFVIVGFPVIRFPQCAK